MTSKGAPQYTRGSARFDVPSEISAEVGSLMIRWAYLEYALQTIIWNLTGLTMPVGRLAVREPRADERVRLIMELAALKGVEVNERACAGIASQARDIAKNRDILAHGYWFYDQATEKWHVVLSRGKWPDKEHHPRSKTVVPEALIVTPIALQEIIRQVEATIRLSELLAEQVRRQLPPPLEISPSQLSRKSPK